MAKLEKDGPGGMGDLPFAHAGPDKLRQDIMQGHVVALAAGAQNAQFPLALERLRHGQHLVAGNKAVRAKA